MSRFFLITAQTKEFPAMLVMISTVVTIVTAVSVDSHMTLSVLVAITEIRRNMYFAKDIPITLFHKMNVQWQLPSPFSELGNQRCCSSKKIRLKFLVFDLLQFFGVLLYAWSRFWSYPRSKNNLVVRSLPHRRF